MPFSLSDEFFPLALACFPNLEHLDLIGNNFTVLPECMQEFRFLYWINVDDCKHLREIRGIPPCLSVFSAVNCKSLNPEGTGMLLNQELHEGGSTEFMMPGGMDMKHYLWKRNGIMRRFRIKQVTITFMRRIAREIGMHVLKKESLVMQDIRFTDPYKMTQLLVMMLMLSKVFPNHKNQPLLPERCIGLCTLQFLAYTLFGGRA
ncbi:hypothetical protein S83_052654 [Arachis hypogaea]